MVEHSRLKVHFKGETSGSIQKRKEVTKLNINNNQARNENYF